MLNPQKIHKNAVVICFLYFFYIIFVVIKNVVKGAPQ